MLLAHQAGAAWHPASLTKLMTVYVAFRAIKAGELKLTQKIKMTKSAAKQPPSKLGFKPGNRFSVDFAIRALMVRSANDVAVALGQAVAGGSEQRFVALMNANAKRLGMTATHFVNPHQYIISHPNRNLLLSCRIYRHNAFELYTFFFFLLLALSVSFFTSCVNISFYFI